MRCPSCSAENPAGHRFCGSCGQAIGSPSQMATAALPGGPAMGVGRLISSDSIPAGGFTPGTILADHRSFASTDAALEREIDAALAVDSSPEFLARVRTRIAAEPEPSTWRLSWTLAAAGAMVATFVMVVAVARVDRARSSAPASRSATPEKPSVNASASVAPPIDPRGAPALIAAPQSPPSTLGVSTAVPVSNRRVRSVAVRAKEPDVLVSPDEAAGLRRLIAIVRDGRVDLIAALGESTRATRALQPQNEIVVEPIAAFVPITLEPLGPLSHDEGVRQ